jgi:hypothetical protein
VSLTVSEIEPSFIHHGMILYRRRPLAWKGQVSAMAAAAGLDASYLSVS